MRIGFYHDGAGRHRASASAVYTRRIAAELADSSDVTVYTGPGPAVDSLVEAGVRVAETATATGLASAGSSREPPCDRRGLSTLTQAARGVSAGVFDRIDREVDLLVTFQTLDDLLVSNLVDVPTVRVFHGEFAVGPLAAIRERVSRTDYHLSTSQSLAHRLDDGPGIDVDGVVPPGVDVDTFTPSGAPAFETDEAAVCFVGPVVESAGIFDLIDAIALVERPIHLRVVGDGALEAVARRAKRRGVAADVRLEGPVAHSSVPEYMRAADVCCRPSRTERFGIANLEAMACGTPVVATEHSAVGSYLQAGEHGLVVPPNSPESIANALGVLLADEDRRSEMGRRARRRAHEFTWYDQAARFETVCERLLGGRSTGPRVPVVR